MICVYVVYASCMCVACFLFSVRMFGECVRMLIVRSVVCFVNAVCIITACFVYALHNLRTAAVGVLHLHVLLLYASCIDSICI